MNMSLLLFLSLSVSVISHAHSGDFLPYKAHIPVGSKTLGGLNERQFHNVIDKVERTYIPKFKTQGRTLKINRKWSESEVNANAQKIGSVSVINVFGGIARHHRMTEDGLTLVICHEIGHHLGGAPKKNQLTLEDSNEGQADYFASLKCLREVFLRDDNASLVKFMRVPQIVTKNCQKVYKTSSEVSLCQRVSMAGKSVANLFADRMEQLPEFEYASTWVALETYDGYPSPQCRLDTYFQGALCDRPLEEKLSDFDPSIGTCHPRYGDQIGMRPLCWFKP